MSSYSEGQIHQLANAFEKAGFTAEDITKLGQNKDGILSELLGVLGGAHEINPIKHTADLSVDPRHPDSDSVVKEHQLSEVVQIYRWRDDLFVNDRKVELVRAKEQESRGVPGVEVHDFLGGKTALNANMCGFLYDNRELIPSNWKGKKVYFWGTIFYFPEGIDEPFHRVESLGLENLKDSADLQQCAIGRGSKVIENFRWEADEYAAVLED